MKKNLLNAIVLIAAGMVLPSALAAEEPCDRFLEALRDAGHYDVAIDYLDEMQTSPLASKRFKQTIPFEKADTLIKSSVGISNLDALESRLSEAERLLKKAAELAKTPELKARSQNNRGDLLFRRAAIFLKRSENTRLTADEREQQYVKARGFLEQALVAFGDAKSSYKNLVDNFKFDSRDPESRQQRRWLRATYTAVRVKLPQIIEKFADTLDKQNPERTKSLESAVADFEELWQKYPNFPAGLDSCLSAARCNWKLGKNAEALSFILQLFALSDDVRLLPLKLKASALAADCWSAMSPYPFDEVIANFEPPVKRLNRRDRQNPLWQRVQLELAKAYHAKSEDLKATSPTDGRIKELERDTSKLIKTLARTPGEHRNAAKSYLTKWNLTIAEETASVLDTSEIKTFAEAKQRGINLITEIEVNNADAVDLRRRINAGPSNQLESELAAAEAKLKSLTAQCLTVLDHAMNLADKSTAIREINHVRFLQSACHYVQGYFFEASLIGEFLVDRFPNIDFSRQAGGVALRSYAAMYEKSNSTDREFEQQRLMDLATKLVDRWPGGDEAIEAAVTLTKLLLAKKDLNDDDIQRVTQLTATVPESSIERSALQLQLGNTLWFAYRRLKANPDSDPEYLQKKLAQAGENLANGLKNFTPANLRMDAAWGTLFLINVHLESGDLKAALEQLESAAVAPIDLLKEKNQVIFSSSRSDLYTVETYKVAAKVYLEALTALPDQADTWTDKATNVIRALNARAVRKGDAKAKQDVVNMYGLIAVQLKKRLSEFDDLAGAERFTKSLSRFLETLQNESDDANTIVWTGETMLNLGELLAQQGLTKEAKPLFASANASFVKAEKLGVKDPKLLTELKRQQALAKRASGDFEVAFNSLAELLKQNPQSWRVQIDAAQTLQAWGSKTQKKATLAKALSGTQKFRDPKTKRQRNLIWGWTKLADAFKNKEQLKTPYYQSLMGAVESRLEYGIIEGNRKIVAAALKRLNIAKAAEDNLGGVEWKDRFDDLEQRIKKQLESM